MPWKCCLQGMIGPLNPEVSAAITCTRTSQQDRWSTFQQAALTELSGLLTKKNEDVKREGYVLGMLRGSGKEELGVVMINMHC